MGGGKPLLIRLNLLSKCGLSLVALVMLVNAFNCRLESKGNEEADSAMFACVQAGTKVLCDLIKIVSA